MSGWVAKRFWTAASAEPVGDAGFAVRLDGRPIKTPAKAPLTLPTLALARAIAEEWDAQQGKIDPLSMPLTRAANAAIDKVTPQFSEVASLVAAYGADDLICYRAEAPQSLVDRQAAGWDPLLAWANDTLRAPLFVVTGVIHADQPPCSLDALSARVTALTPFELTALHELVALSGSLILALAVSEGRLAPELAWQLSRIDEDYQVELWGRDDEAAALTERRRADFLQAHRFWIMARDRDTDLY